MSTGLEGLTDDAVQGHTEEWVRHLALDDRDPRLIVLAMNRALKLPDDAGAVQRASSLMEHQHVYGQSLPAMFEVQYQALLAEVSSHDPRAAGSPVIRWIESNRDAEKLHGREWWALERLRLDYLRRWVDGDFPTTRYR